MKLTPINGNTWVAEGMEWIPFYKLDDHRCILLDTGLHQEQEELEEALLSAGLTPAGILNSHAHVDHCGNNRYFQEKYGAQVAMTPAEAGMCCSLLNLKCYFLLLSPGTVERESSHMIHTPDVLVPAQDGPFSFLGAEFQILHTPGHSSQHVCVITPDNVCYTADALLSHELLTAKLPYNLCHTMAQASRDKLRGLGCDLYLMAHRGMCTSEEIDGLIDENHALVNRRCREILELITRPMTASQIAAEICGLYELFTRKPPRSLRFERNIRFFLEYMVDSGQLELVCQKGVTYYRPAQG